jgi:ATP-dependent Clp protease ATP-binding subunit ClpA
MQREIEDKLAQLLLAGDVSDGSVVRADVAQTGEALNLEVVG